MEMTDFHAGSVDLMKKPGDKLEYREGFWPGKPRQMGDRVVFEAFRNLLAFVCNRWQRRRGVLQGERIADMEPEGYRLPVSVF